ncbi:unnamed protein product [Soboliphyme baturini]|uniref:EamA domain-containing protein n=1 Tax=Soboliphyme baturini TaxID=241478 RepID=A0A183IUZ9_9BILA|nr:unnamed protein product [Soboliphyme baturini]
MTLSLDQAERVLMSLLLLTYRHFLYIVLFELLDLHCVERTSQDEKFASSNRLLGDIFCLAGAALYGVSNVFQEWMLKSFKRSEYLGMLGIFGSFISGIQLFLLTIVSTNLALLYAGFALSMFIFYSLVCVMIEQAGATMFNLSILSADFYTFFISYFLFNEKFHGLYFGSYVLVFVGSVLYSVKDPGSRDNSNNVRPRSYEEISGVTTTRPELSSVSSTDVAMKYCPVHGALFISSTSPVDTAENQPSSF